MTLRVAAVRGADGQGVIIVDMTVSAGIHLTGGGQLVRIGQREAGGAVIKGGIQEGNGVMAIRAIRRGKRSTGCGVHGIVRSLPATPVVGVQVALRVAAIGRLDRQIVVVVDMAIGAGIHFSSGSQLMRIAEREAGGAVIKVRRGPGSCVVARGASGHRENVGRRGMRGIGSLLPGGQVALRVAAIGRGNLQVVIIVDMAGCAGNVGMPVAERETRGAVIKGSIQPGNRIVTSRADRYREAIRRS